MKVNLFGKQAEFKTEFVVIAVTVLILLGCMAGYIFFRDDSDIIIEAGGTEPASETTPEAVPERGQKEEAGTSGGAIAVKEDAVSKEQIKVYVVGSVKKPGIVTLEKGQMIDDAVRKAGGLTEEADANSINMVYELNENMMLYIKSKREIEAKQTAGDGSPAVKGDGGDSGLGKGAAIVTDSGGSAEITGVEKDGGMESSNVKTASAKININTAGAGELDTLPGVGEATARDIMAFRETNGPFRKIEDIMKVPRIKQNRFESIKEFITVD